MHVQKPESVNNWYGISELYTSVYGLLQCELDLVLEELPKHHLQRYSTPANDLIGEQGIICLGLLTTLCNLHRCTLLAEPRPHSHKVAWLPGNFVRTCSLGISMQIH